MTTFTVVAAEEYATPGVYENVRMTRTVEGVVVEVGVCTLTVSRDEYGTHFDIDRPDIVAALFVREPSGTYSLGAREPEGDRDSG